MIRHHGLNGLGLDEERQLENQNLKLENDASGAVRWNSLTALHIMRL